METRGCLPVNAVQRLELCDLKSQLFVLHREQLLLVFQIGDVVAGRRHVARLIKVQQAERSSNEKQPDEGAASDHPRASAGAGQRAVDRRYLQLMD